MTKYTAVWKVRHSGAGFPCHSTLSKH